MGRGLRSAIPEETYLDVYPIVLYPIPNKSNHSHCRESAALLYISGMSGAGGHQTAELHLRFQTSPNGTKKSRPHPDSSECILWAWIKLPLHMSLAPHTLQILAPARDRFVGANGEFALTTSVTIVVSRMLLSAIPLILYVCF